MRVNPGESYSDIIPDEYYEPDYTPILERLADEFNEMEERGIGRTRRDPRDWLIHDPGDELVGAAYLVCQGKREEGIAAFLHWIDVARDKYVEAHIEDMIEDLKNEY